MTAPARIAFAGTPEFALPALRALVAAGAPLPFVLTRPDSAAGRGRRVSASPVKLEAEALGLHVEQPASLADGSLRHTLGPAPDLLVVVAYGLLLPQWLLDWPKRGCVNLHASLLPRWRGAAPIQHAILSGDATTGVSIVQMEPGLDTGPVYAERSVSIGAGETAGELHDRLARTGAELLEQTLPGILAGSLIPVAQRHEQATYASKIAKSDAPLDWRTAARALERRVRAFNPWPVAEARLNDGRRLRVWQAEALAGPPGSPGTIVAARPAGIDVATGEGLLRLTSVQPSSARVMTARAYLAAHSLDGVAFVC